VKLMAFSNHRPRLGFSALQGELLDHLLIQEKVEMTHCGIDHCLRRK
jgi:hypothetical protein